MDCIVTSEMIFSDMNTVSASPKVHPPNGTRYYTFQVCRFNIINFNQLSFFIKFYFPLINNYIVLMSNTIYMTIFFLFILFSFYYYLGGVYYIKDQKVVIK